jgi:hypothetical protein
MKLQKQNPIIKINSNKTNSNQKNGGQIWYKKLKGDEIKKINFINNFK